jgi:hypothetical protein
MIISCWSCWQSPAAPKKEIHAAAHPSYSRLPDPPMMDRDDAHETIKLR